MYLYIVYWDCKRTKVELHRFSLHKLENELHSLKNTAIHCNVILLEFCRYGVPSGETTVTCTAGVGTTIIEFGTLSRLTGNPVFEEAAMRALRGLWHHRSSIGLVGNHIDVSRYNFKKILYLKFRELAT